MSIFSKTWDASPIEQTHTVKLTISSNNYWMVATGFLAGFLLALILFAGSQSEIDARSVEKGVFTHDGRAFRLVEMKP